MSRQTGSRYKTCAPKIPCCAGYQCDYLRPLSADGLEDCVLKLALNGWLHLYTSEPILAEYERVLRAKKFSFNISRVRDTLSEIRTNSEVVRPQDRLAICPDSDDNKFLECAATAEAEFLVTGNKRHFPKRYGQTQIVNARELLEIIGPALGPALGPAGKR